MQKEESGVSFNEACYYASIPLSAAEILGGAVLVGSGPLGWTSAAGMFLVGSGVGGAYYTYNTEKSDFEFTKYCKKSLASGLASGAGGVVMTLAGPSILGGMAGGAFGGAVGGVANSVLEGRGFPDAIKIGKSMLIGGVAGGVGQVFNFSMLPIMEGYFKQVSPPFDGLDRLFLLGLNAVVNGVAAGATKVAANVINGAPFAEDIMDSAKFGFVIGGAIACAQVSYIGDHPLKDGFTDAFQARLAANIPRVQALNETFLAFVRPQVLSQVAQAESAQFWYEQAVYDKANVKYLKTFKEIKDFLDGCDEKSGFKLEKGKKITKDEAATALLRGEQIWCTKKGGKEEIVKCQYPHYVELQRAKVDLEEAKQRVGIKVEEQLRSLYAEEQAAYEKANAAYQSAFDKCIERLSEDDEEIGFKLEVENGATINVTKNEAATAMMYGQKILAREKAANKNFIYSYPHPNYAEELMKTQANLAVAMQRVGAAMVEQLLRPQYPKEYAAVDKANAVYQDQLKDWIKILEKYIAANRRLRLGEVYVTKEIAADAILRGIPISLINTANTIVDECKLTGFYFKELQQAQANLAAAMQKAGIKMMEQLVPHRSAEEQAASEKGSKFVQPPSVQSPPATQNANNMTGEDVLVGAQKYLKEFGLRLEMIEKLDLPEPEKKFLILEMYINKRALFKFNGKGLFVNPMADLRRIINEIKHKEIEMSKGLDQIRQLAEQYHWNDILEAVMKCSVKEGSLIIKCNDVEYIIKKVQEDGDCGYTALGLTRNTAIELLKANTDKIRKIIKPLIFETLNSNPAFVDSLSEKFKATKSAVDEYHQALAKRNPNLEQDARDKLNKHADNLNLILAFIDFDLNQKQIGYGWPHILILQALAYIQNRKLSIYEIHEGKMIPHRQFPGYQDNDENGRVRVLFSNDNHFDILELYHQAPSNRAPFNYKTNC